MQSTPNESQHALGFKYLGFITSAMAATLIISNIASTKFIEIGFIKNVDGGTFIFPLSYIFGDVLTEVYGYKTSRRVIYTAFFWMLVAALTFQFIADLPYPAEYTYQESFVAILGQTPRILFASLLAYFAGEFTNSYVLAKMKIWTKGRQLWTRTIGSTLIGEMVDTSLFLIVAFAGSYSLDFLLTSFIWVYSVKVAIEVLMTPITYAVVNWLKREEGVDVYDYNTNFNPFALRE